MIVLEVLGEFDEVFGGSKSGREGSMSTKCCSCQRFGASQEAMTSPAPAPEMLRKYSRGCPQKPRVRL